MRPLPAPSAERIEPLERVPRVWVRAWVARTLVIFAIVSALAALGGLGDPTPLGHFICAAAACAALAFAGLRRIVNAEPFCALCGALRKDVEQMVAGKYGSYCSVCVTESMKLLAIDPGK